MVVGYVWKPSSTQTAASSFAGTLQAGNVGEVGGSFEETSIQKTSVSRGIAWMTMEILLLISQTASEITSIAIGV